MYCDLHVHTKYTENKGISKIKTLINKASNYKMDYLGIADSGNISGALEFYKNCMENDIKPVIGCGFYYTFLKRTEEETSKNHIVLIAKNNNGLKNIAKLVILSYKEGFYLKPRIDKELLKRYSDDLILFTGGLGGPIDKMILKDDIKGAKGITNYFLDIFQKEDLFLEIQDNGKKENMLAAQGLSTLKKDLDISIITSGGSFYVDKKDYGRCNEVRLKNGNNTLKGDYHFKSEDEMVKSVIIPKKAIENTELVAKKVKINLNLKRIKEILNLEEYINGDNQKRAEIFLEYLGKKG
ncbi:MAG: PHP domain-containing protein [Fusobacteriota bacterium]